MDSQSYNSNNNNNMTTTSSSTANSTTTTTTNNEDQLENLSNLIINTSTASTAVSAETALIEQYEYEMDKALNENLIIEKEQMNQRLFQSFQTSACTVAQMFKDKSTGQQPQPSQLTSWQSFQNSAGAITVLYKG